VNAPTSAARMRLARAGIDTYQEPIVYMRADCAVCRAEGFEAQARVWVEVGSRRIIATLNVLTDGGWLERDTAAFTIHDPTRVGETQIDGRKSFHHIGRSGGRGDGAR